MILSHAAVNKALMHSIPNTLALLSDSVCDKLQESIREKLNNKLAHYPWFMDECCPQKIIRYWASEYGGLGWPCFNCNNMTITVIIVGIIDSDLHNTKWGYWQLKQGSTNMICKTCNQIRMNLYVILHRADATEVYQMMLVEPIIDLTKSDHV